MPPGNCLPWINADSAVLWWGTGHLLAKPAPLCSYASMLLRFECRSLRSK